MRVTSPALAAAVTDGAADAGADDADRCFFVDDTGEFVPGD